MKEEKRKIFCSECRHSNNMMSWWEFYMGCSSHPEVIEDWRSRRFKFAKCSEKNADNNCSEFKQIKRSFATWVKDLLRRKDKRHECMLTPK